MGTLGRGGPGGGAAYAEAFGGKGLQREGCTEAVWLDGLEGEPQKEMQSDRAGWRGPMQGFAGHSELQTQPPASRWPQPQTLVTSSPARHLCHRGGQAGCGLARTE